MTSGRKPGGATPPRVSSPKAPPGFTPARQTGAGSVTGIPHGLLRLEGIAVLGLAVWAYVAFGSGWILFALVFFLPDLSMLGYLAGPRIGALLYNTAHTYLGPAAFGAAGILSDQPLALSLALIWSAHIGFDRALGYGLKYMSGFGDTHLARLRQRTPRLGE